MWGQGLSRPIKTRTIKLFHQFKRKLLDDFCLPKEKRGMGQEEIK